MVRRAFVKDISFKILEAPDQSELLLDATGAAAFLGRLARAGLRARALRQLKDGHWVPCAAHELLDDTEVATIVQRPSCLGLVTTVFLWSESGIPLGAWMADREPENPEPPAWRVLLLQCLLRTWQSSLTAHGN